MSPLNVQVHRYRLALYQLDEPCLCRDPQRSRTRRRRRRLIARHRQQRRTMHD